MAEETRPKVGDGASGGGPAGAPASPYAMWLTALLLVIVGGLAAVTLLRSPPSPTAPGPVPTPGPVPAGGAGAPGAETQEPSPGEGGGEGGEVVPPASGGGPDEGGRVPAGQADREPTQEPTVVQGPGEFTGLLRGGMMGIGGEHTGFVLEGTRAGDLEVDLSRVSAEAARHVDRRVTVKGRVEQRQYVERGPTPVLVAEAIDPAE